MKFGAKVSKDIYDGLMEKFEEALKHIGRMEDQIEILLADKMKLESENKELEDLIKQLEELVEILETENTELINETEYLRNFSKNKKRRSKQNAGTGGKFSATPLQVIIKWDEIGVIKPDEIIQNKTGSQTFVKVIERLSEELGAEILNKLCSLRVNRGYLVTKNPNSKYNYGKINGYSILTNTSTPEKRDNLKNAIKFLGLPQSLLSF